jgi:peptidyl-prolyl cis-trans isomerase SurA
MKIKKNLINVLLLTFFFINISNDSFAFSTNKIIVTVENQIVSSYELKNKIKTVLFLNNQNINQENIDAFKKQALKQLIDFKLKKNEVQKFNIQINNNEQVNNFFKNLSSKYQTDTQGIKKIFKDNKLDFDLYFNEIKTEFDWQKLVFQKFGNKINLNEKEINEELSNFIKTQKNFFEYKLAEIEIPLKNNSDDQKTIASINKQINEIGFEKTALKYSISTSAMDGGNLGWINSKSLSEEILKILKNMNKGDLSEPIIQTDTATILKLLDKKIINVTEADLDKLRKQIVNNKKNELLNLYSNNYLSKIKNNALIELK